MPQSVLDKFRRAVFIKHKNFYGNINTEFTRALSLHADLMILEANNQGNTGVSMKDDEADAEPNGFVEFAGVFDGTNCEEDEGDK